MIPSPRVAILTVSDRSAAGLREDTAGPALFQRILSQSWPVVKHEIIADDLLAIQDILIRWVESGEIDVIFTCGGTGFSARDVTPEATQAIIERAAPGIAEAMRASSLLITPHAMLSRATAGIRKKTLIINLPGSPKGALENLQVILPVLPHAVQLLSDDPQAEAGHQLF